MQASYARCIEVSRRVRFDIVRDVKTMQSLIASVCLAVFAAGCNPVEPVSAAVAKAAEPTLPFHPDVAPGSGDGGVYEYH